MTDDLTVKFVHLDLSFMSLLSLNYPTHFHTVITPKVSELILYNETLFHSSTIPFYLYNSKTSKRAKGEAQIAVVDLLGILCGVYISSE